MPIIAFAITAADYRLRDNGLTQHYPPLTGTSPSGTTLKWQRSREDTLYLSRQRTAQSAKLLALSY